MSKCYDCKTPLTTQNTYLKDKKKGRLDYLCKSCRRQRSVIDRLKNKKQREAMLEERERVLVAERTLKTKQKLKNGEIKEICGKCYWGRYIELESKYICMFPRCLKETLK